VPWGLGSDRAVELETASYELYGLVPGEFTAARNAKAADARKDGLPELAAALKRLRKPSTGAWLANLLVRERSSDVERLIGLGEELRANAGDPDGEEVRRVSRERGERVSALVRDANALASRHGQPVSAAAMEECVATLEAAFADPQAADDLRRGGLTRGLHYSGLGFETPRTPSGRGAKGNSAPQRPRSDNVITARRAVEKTEREVKRAEADLVRATRAVRVTQDELQRLRVAESQARQRSRIAHDKAAAAQKRLNGLRGQSGRA
jgi:hypothetical protein